jgi:UDP:flavonoid glycosyltransferase YjiC (YdhE family)
MGSAGAMRISILTLGSRGDVQPYLALAVGLKRAGYSVRLASHAIFEPMIRDYGIDFALVRFNPLDIVNHPEAQRSKSNIVRFMLTVRRIIGPQYLSVFDDFWQACQDAQAIIASPTAANAYECAWTLDVPLIIGLLQPLIPTRQFSSFFLPPFPRFGSLFNRASHHLFNQLLWQNVRTSVNRWRKTRLGLRSAAFFGPYRAMRTQKVPYLIACSPSIIPKPPDWKEWHHVTGYWFLEPQHDFRPGPELEDFLKSGASPVYVGFGSMAQQRPERVTEVIVDAMERSNQRGILAGGWGWSKQFSLPDTMLQVENIPHHWLFPQMTALIHHGGAGTTAAALRSGIPSIVVPFGGDQPHWGRILVKQGLSAAVLPIDDLTAGSLAQALIRTANDRRLRSRTSSVGALIRQEDSVSKAVQIVDRILMGPCN